MWRAQGETRVRAAPPWGPQFRAMLTARPHAARRPRWRRWGRELRGGSRGGHSHYTPQQHPNHGTPEGGRSPRPGSIISRPIQPSGRGPAGAGLGVAAGGRFLTPQRLRGSNLRAPLAASTQRGGAGELGMTSSAGARGKHRKCFRPLTGKPVCRSELRELRAPSLLQRVTREPPTSSAAEGSGMTAPRRRTRGATCRSRAEPEPQAIPVSRAQDLTRGAALDRRRSEPRSQTPNCEAPPVPPGPRRSQGPPTRDTLHQDPATCPPALAGEKLTKEPVNGGKGPRAKYSEVGR